MRTEKVSFDHAISRHESKIDDHEIRISRLEDKSPC